MASDVYTDTQCMSELSHYCAGVGISDLKAGNYDTIASDELQDWMSDHQVQLLHSKTTTRHFKLKKLIQSPYMITTLGDRSLLDAPLLGVVGPRKISLYAQDILDDFFEKVQGYHLATLSGGAAGVDTICHEKSIGLGIPTIMVLGEGLRRALLGPKKHLIKRVVDTGGLVLSEFPLDMPAMKRSFPQRNRIIAGMSEMLFVPAAGKKSGSLISVDFACRMHVPVYTVPGSLYDATSAGTNDYLSRGLIEGVTSFAPLIEKYFTTNDMQGVGSSLPVGFTDTQQELMEKLPASKNTLIQRGVSLVDLTLLEMGGRVGMNDSGEVVRKK